MTHLISEISDEQGIGTLVWEVAKLRRPEPGSSGSGKKRNLIGSGV
jgi:hypothetical protein